MSGANPRLTASERLDFLTRTLGLTGELSGKIRYQLLHRAASAIIEAKRFRANIALMIIESFSAEDRGLTDFKGFTRLFGVKSEPDRIVKLGPPNAITFYAGWVRHSVGASQQTEATISPNR
jgi:hypothetical protein